MCIHAKTTRERHVKDPQKCTTVYSPRWGKSNIYLSTSVCVCYIRITFIWNLQQRVIIIWRGTRESHTAVKNRIRVKFIGNPLHEITFLWRRTRGRTMKKNRILVKFIQKLLHKSYEYTINTRTHSEEKTVFVRRLRKFYYYYYYYFE